ncbi:MAG: NUDIX domain-containing protein [Chloroflexi bacterium]|nr:NUDIX domain-containing protein [Chloroflexota bacterium]
MPGEKQPWEGMIDNFGDSMDKMPDEICPSAAAILFNEDRSEVLLQRRSDNGSWALPAGRMDIGESVAECAVRECEEETGLKTRIKRLVGVYSDPSNYSILRYPSGYSVQYVSSVFEVEYVSGEIHVSEESTAVEWFPVSALPEQVSHSARLRIQDALSGQTEAFYG